MSRVGFGYDAHRFGPLPGGVVLCGVDVDFDRVVEATSDGDVASHALVDALLGAAGMGDLGHYFPSSDPQWNSANSLNVFVRSIAQRVRDAGFRINSADITIVAERVKIAPHREAMRASVAEALDVNMELVSVKATTTDGVGFVGRDEGLAAMAVVSLDRTD